LPDSDNPDAMRAESQVQAQLEMHDFPGAIASLRRAVTADPKFTRSWVLLGQLYISSGKTEESVDAFHKAVDSDPTSPLPLKMLAFALNGAHRTDESIKAWQELLKLTPQDRSVVPILGSLLVSQKRFGEAIPLLESAVKERPEDVDAQMTLGNAYLLSGNQEKGMAAFSEAMKLKPGPGLKNDVGYALAEANVRLPEALQYATEAVQAEETASREVHLDKLDLSALDHTRKLAAYWDTLGWVHFKMLNYPEAETYLSSAWELSQSGVIADHLGQAYEQGGKPEAAVRMYRLALAASPHLTETQKRLDHLAPVKSRPTGKFDLTALNQRRTMKLPRLVPGSATAEFFFLLAPGPKLEDIRFISGSDKLRNAKKALSSTAFNMPFPAGSDARLVRRGVVGCYPASGCSLVLIFPDSVGSVN